MHRWINRASDGERREKQEQLAAALRNTAKDFTAALREMPDLSGEPKSPAQLDGWVSEQYQRWRSKTSQPQIIRAVSLGKFSTNNDLSFTHLNLATPQPVFVKSEWPETLMAFRQDLLARVQHKSLQPMSPGAIAQFQPQHQFFLVLPLTTSIQPPLPARLPPPRRKFQLPLMEPPPMDMPPDRRRRPEGPPPPFVRQRWEEQRKRMEEQQKQIETEMQKERQETERRVQELRKERPRIEQLAGFCFLELDSDFLQKQFLPQLIAQHFNSIELSNYQVAVVIEPEQQPFLATNHPLSTFDAQETLFQGEATAWRGSVPASPNTLSIRVQHKADSLPAVINRTRWRNLAFGYGLLLLLFVSSSALLIATHRARVLAQRQMEFVAGVTHELRTPLTAIQSAGFNLSSGRVNDAERVRQYGTMIHTEGRRLADLIDQVLSYARIEANGKSSNHSYQFQSLQIDDIIERAFGEYQAAFTGWRVEKSIEADLPPIQADANVLTSALKNLLQNALKYAEQGKWLRLQAARVKNEVQITVADHGPGIDRRDLPHIFAPFYRARKMVASAVPGTGLGLSLVNEYMKAHQGRVTVDSAAGKGTAFTLHLPIHSATGKSS